MNRIIKIALVAMLIIAGGVTTMAQNDNNGRRISREILAQKQAQYISDQLALDDNTSAKFITTFCDYQKEVWALGPRIGKKASTESESQTLMKNRFERSQKILELRQKYYEKYSKFLTQKQIERVYQMEKQMMERLSMRHKRARAQRNSE
jgi:hypothetical protein